MKKFVRKITKSLKTPNKTGENVKKIKRVKMKKSDKSGAINLLGWGGK